MLEEGTALGGWTLLSRLGEGTFGVVFHARKDAVVGAIKVLFDPREAALQRLQNEVDVLSDFDHPGIPALLDHDLASSPPFIVMELAEGRPISEWLDDESKTGGYPGDVEALETCQKLLEILAYVHGEGWVHRDIKDANVLRTETGQISLIDFGFCKKDRTSEMRSADSFFRVGAARYSPPAKLDNPATAVASHDVFAVGVLGYRILTGEFPWAAAPEGDRGVLRLRQEENPPQPIHSLNSTVRPQVSGFLMDLLETEDRRRMSAKQALETANSILKAVTADTSASRLSPSLIHLPHVTRDPLHGDIRLTELEWEALDSREMQRLRWIRQLGLTNLVFVGAEHTRLSHALGSLHRVEQIFRTIEATSGTPIDPETRLTSRLYALVHDVAHIPFGHTLEDELGFFKPHDENEDRIRRLVLSAPSELGKVLRQNAIGMNVLALFRRDASIQDRSSIRELIAGATGADVLDYIDRDAYFCGLDHRVDSAIFRQFRLHRGVGPDPRFVNLLYGKHGLRIDRTFAVEDLLNVRYAMFLKVYTHPGKAAAAALLGKALADAVRTVRGKPDLTERDLEELGDDSLLDRLGSSKRKVASTLGRALRRRRLPIPVYRRALLPGDDEILGSQYEAKQDQLRQEGYFDPAGRLAIERALGKAAQVDPWKIAVYCPLRAPGHQKTSLWVSSAPGAATAMDSVSRPLHVIQQRHLRLWEIWVFVFGEKEEAERVQGAAEYRFGEGNQIRADRRQNRLF